MSNQSESPTVKSRMKEGPFFLLMARLIQTEYFGITLIILVSTVLNCYMVFFSSDYHNYLTSDMHGYWQRAMQIFNGDEMNANTWASNAPFYSRVMASILTWINYLYLKPYFLEFILAINILMSAIGNVALYFIGKKLFGTRRSAMGLAAIYAFSYPSLYFNTFVLGEPFAVPLIITSLCMVMYMRDSNKVIFAGLLLGFAVGVRPSNGTLGLPCALYILCAGLSFSGFRSLDWWKAFFPRIVRAGLFSIGFFAVIFGVIAENNRVSHGKLRGITAHSGYNFFLGQTQAHMIESRYDGIMYGFVPSSVANHPEYGTVKVKTPIYDSKTYFEEGRKVLKQHPELWFEHILKLDNLFFNNLFPGVAAVWGFNPLMDVFRYLSFYMLILGLGFAYISLKEKVVKKSDFMLFGSILLLCTISLFMFTVTHQYFLNFSYTVYVLFGMSMVGVIRHFKRYRHHIARGLAALVIIVSGYYTYKLNTGLFMDNKVKVTLVNNDGRVYSFKQKPKPLSEEVIYIDELRFEQSFELKHEKLGKVGENEYKENFFLTAETQMNVLNDGLYMLQVYADDGYQVFLDDRLVMGFDGLKKMAEFKVRKDIRIKKGKHKLRIELFQAGVLSGLVGYIRRIDNVKPYAPYEYDTKKGKGPYIGQDSADITYSVPE